MKLLKHTRRIVLVLALSALVSSGQVGAQAVDTGSANFSKYVSLGDSLTAAFASGGLLNTVQANSYPALINRQVTGNSTSFQQPTVSAPGIPALLDLVSLSPLVIAPRSSSTGAPTNLGLPRPYDNLAVPGFKVKDLLSTFTGNGIIDLILRGPAFGNRPALAQALILRPTFVTLWAGNNDVLGAATSGIVIEGVTLTPAADFDRDYRALVGQLRASGAQLALATIPSVTAIPFVTTIPPVVINPATNQPVLNNGQLIPLIGPNGPLALTDRVLLTASGQLAQGIGIPRPLGTGQPLGNQFVLSTAEVATIGARVAAYNNTIRSVADQTGSALFDANVLFDRIAARGLNIGGLRYTPAFLTGGLFSYDGVHPTSFGYAFVANEFIKAINSKFGASIPQVDLFPFTFGDAATAGTVTEVEAASAVFDGKAYDNLRQSLRMPTTQWLLQRVGNAGGGNDGYGGGGTPAPPAPPGNVDRPARPVDRE